MRVAWASWVQGLVALAKAALFITLAFVIVQQVYFGRPSVLFVPMKRGATEAVPAPPLGVFP